MSPDGNRAGLKYGVRALGAVAFFAAILLADGPAHSEDYPSRPIRLIVASSPSSAADIVGRILAQSLGNDLGRQVIVDNRAGAGGNLGAQIAASALPDGYTLFLATPAHVISSNMSRRPLYDLQRDFVPISQVSSGVYVIAANPTLALQNIGQLIALAQARPGQINYASGGIGNATHLAVELFKTMAGIDVVHLPYQGAGPALVALIAGEAQFAVANLSAVLSHVGSGKLKVLAVTGGNRSSFVPQIPTVAESGVAGYEVTAWLGLLAPKGVSHGVVSKLNAVVVKAADAQETRTYLARAGAEPAAGPSGAFAAFIESERKKWAQVISKAGLASN
jgi:tripartite-type tricarboxylate transporter receptor subunit TctC